jgi:heme-degrading monooxygenase HmoA
MTYLVLWEFRVAAEATSAFERLYGPDGAWVGLFRTAAGYLGTELLHDDTDPARYLTVDRWDSQSAYDQFRQAHVARYRHLDEEGDRLTADERQLGAFTLLGGAER